MDLKTTLDQCPPLRKQLTSLKHRFLQPLNQDDLTTSYERRPKRKFSSLPLGDDDGQKDPSSWKRIRFTLRREKEDDAVFVESPRVKSSQLTIRQRSTSDDSPDTMKHRVEEAEEEGFTSDAVFYKPWFDNLRLKRQRLGEDQDPSSCSPSVDDIAALTLIQFSRDNRQSKTQTLVPQPQTQTQTRTQTQTQTQTQSQTQTQTQTQQQTAVKSDLFECTVCGKGFTTYQALGGHKASHRVKPPLTLVENAGADGGDKTRTKMLAPSGKIHKCSICHVVFPTGQALGGHKRRHYEGVLGGHKLSPDSNASSLVTKVLDPEQSLSVSENVLLSGHKRNQDEVVHKLSPDSNGSLVTKVLSPELSENVLLSGHKLSQEEVVPSVDKWSLSDASVAKNLVNLELSLGESNGLLGGQKRSQEDEEVVLGENKWSPSCNGSGVTNVSEPEQTQRRLIDLNSLPSPEFDESGVRDVEEVDSAIMLANRLGEDQDPSSCSPSVDDIAALTLIQFSRDNRQSKTQTLVPQPQTQTQTRTQTQTQTQTQSQTQTQTQTQQQTAVKSDLFECTVCGKGFTTYQALGGHKASHRVKPPLTLVENAGADGGDKTRTKMLAPSGKIHKCSICHVVFPTGQALGGHKRRHYEGVLGGHKLSPDSNASSLVTKVLDPEQSLSVSENVLLSGHKRNQDEVVHKLSPDSNGSLVTKVLSPELSENVLLSGHKLSQEEVVPSVDKWSLSDASVAKNLVNLELSLGESNGLLGGQKRSQEDEEVVLGENKWSPSCNGSGVTNVSEPEQTQRRLIDLNSLPSPEFDESGVRDVEEGFFFVSDRYRKRIGMAISTHLKQILTKVNQVSPSMSVADLKKKLELWMQENKDGLLVDDDVFVESFLETIERNCSATGDQDPNSERRVIKAIEHRFLEGVGGGEEDSSERTQRQRFGYDGVSTETGLDSSERTQRQRFGDDEDCFSEQSSSFLETNPREGERQGGFANNDAFLELLVENIERSRRGQKRSSSSDDDDVKDPSSSSSLSEDEIAALFHKRHSPTQPETQPQLKQKRQMLNKSDAYKCSVCGKEFTTFQALGGHKAGHRIKPLLVEGGEKTRQKLLAPSGKIHKCSICHRVFPTGQSLGGHKRLHYEGALGGHKDSMDVEAVSQGDKLSPGGNVGVVTHVPDPKQSLEGLIDTNRVLSPGDVESANELRQEEGSTNANRIQFFNFF
ncbi:PREDICTED: uncharacterized protein LOC104759895 [Camelina sativa]|uniref:Uncharacterized protein LOC104759895 n=1 Tax=Camelina sativa TaxID=90675 RepID=A0ABM1R6C5_CAMSA|nr:PREDICTED: uncharacterized protein LOC104759895 [Camelina sativa]